MLETGTEQSTEDATRIFRRERIISNAELRVEVARRVARNILGSEDITLESKQVENTGEDGTHITRGGRDRTVTGSYTRTLTGSDTFTIGASVTEEARSGVNHTMSSEAESIVGGAYTNVVTGAYMRLAAWCDFLAWGGWVEADVVRIEISAAAIRAYWSYNHAAGAKITVCGKLVDDFRMRNETQSILMDKTVSSADVGTPGSGTILAT